jgi:hypothetical protein
MAHIGSEHRKIRILTHHALMPSTTTQTAEHYAGLTSSLKEVMVIKETIISCANAMKNDQAVLCFGSCSLALWIFWLMAGVRAKYL